MLFITLVSKNVSDLNWDRKCCSRHHRCVGVCFIPLTPLLPVLHCPKMCSTESGASDVTCGWLYCSLHHLWIHIHPKKTKHINNSEMETIACFTTATILWLNVALKMIYCTKYMSQYNKSMFTIRLIMYSLATFQLTVVPLKYICKSWLDCIITPESHWSTPVSFTEEAYPALFQHCVLYKTHSEDNKASERCVGAWVSKPRCLFGNQPSHQKKNYLKRYWFWV